MKIYALQHVFFEDCAHIEAWAKIRGHKLSYVRLYENEPCTKAADVDLLIILGGPMNIYEEDRYPWLASEKRFIEKAIKSAKLVLGICLGAQLITDVLGGVVRRNQHKEIGWFPVELTHEGRKASMVSALPSSFMALHWHGDTFSIPPRCKHIAMSEACRYQAFQYTDRVLALQFHLETTMTSLESLINNCRHEIEEGMFVQTETVLRARSDSLPQMNNYMEHLLTHFEVLHARSG